MQDGEVVYLDKVEYCPKLNAMVLIPRLPIRTKELLSYSELLDYIKDLEVAIKKLRPDNNTK